MEVDAARDAAGRITRRVHPDGERHRQEQVRLRGRRAARRGLHAGNPRAGNLRAGDIRVLDEQDEQVGQITKTWQGLGKAAFTTADNYVVQLHRPLRDPLISMVLASALTVDTTLSQRD